MKVDSAARTALSCSLSGRGSIIFNMGITVQGIFFRVHVSSCPQSTISLSFAGNGLSSARRWRNIIFQPSQKPLHSVRHTSKQSAL